MRAQRLSAEDKTPLRNQSRGNCKEPAAEAITVFQQQRERPQA